MEISSLNDNFFAKRDSKSAYRFLTLVFSALNDRRQNIVIENNNELCFMMELLIPRCYESITVKSVAHPCLLTWEKEIVSLEKEKIKNESTELIKVKDIIQRVKPDKVL